MAFAWLSSALHFNRKKNINTYNCSPCREEFSSNSLTSEKGHFTINKLIGQTVDEEECFGACIFKKLGKLRVKGSLQPMVFADWHSCQNAELPHTLDFKESYFKEDTRMF